jgi:hypothetical protein
MSTVSTEVSGVTVELRVPRRVAAGSPVRAIITMTNNRDDPVHILRKDGTGKHCDYRIAVVDGEGRSCVRTEYGRFNLVREPVEVGGSAGVQTLKHGERQVWEIDLNQCFELPVGRLSTTVYVAAFAGESGEIRLTCNDCIFEVTR